MPWQEMTKVQERLLFIAKYEEGESMASLCREFGISRKTGYKFLNRYREDGPKGLDDLRRRPYRNPNKIKQMVVDLVVALKQDKPRWDLLKFANSFNESTCMFPCRREALFILFLNNMGL